MSDLLDNVYKPDVIACLSDLSSDEVLTPPEIANQMLDLLPHEIWSDPNIKILDPACKSGVFLREAAKRFIEGEKDIIPDLQQRIDHVMHNQLYGIAITEMTSLMSRRTLYCSKYPNGPYSISKFDTAEGNIRFRRINHTWIGNSCKYCGATKEQYDRSTDLETHAYEFIHLKNLKETEKMHFDVIVSNPCYQLSDGGNSRSAKPIYNLFVQQAMKLNPRYLSMIIPSRWFVGGKGLDSFRSAMLNDDRIRTLVDYENAHDAFPGVDVAGGICYFLWEKNYHGLCSVVNFSQEGTKEKKRKLNEYDVFVRQNEALDIVKKVTSNHPGKFLDERVSSRKPFGLPTNYQPKEQGLPCWFIKKIGKKYAFENDVTDTKNYLNKYKLLVPKAPIAGQTDFSKPVSIYYDGNMIVAKPGECCTESFIILGAFDTLEETLSYKSYILTKVVRFLLLQAVVSQDITKKNYLFVPDLGHYSGSYTDEQLCDLWGISEEEWNYIDSRIRNSGEKEE